jgi:hypothetical protein
MNLRKNSTCDFIGLNYWTSYISNNYTWSSLGQSTFIRCSCICTVWRSDDTWSPLKRVFFHLIKWCINAKHFIKEIYSWNLNKELFHFTAWRKPLTQLTINYLFRRIYFYCKIMKVDCVILACITDLDTSYILKIRWEFLNYEIVEYNLPFGFIAPKHLNYLAFDLERNWWRLFQKRVVRTKFEICVYILE